MFIAATPQQVRGNHGGSSISKTSVLAGEVSDEVIIRINCDNCLASSPARQL